MGCIKDLHSQFLVVSILCISMIPLWGYGYLMYILIALLPLIFRYTNKTSALIFAFSVTYALPLLVYGNLSISITIFYLLFPLIMFHAGLYLGKRFKLSQSGILMMVLLTSSLALPAIVANVQDFIQTGQLVNVLRRVSVYSDKDLVMSATVYGMMVSLMAGSIGILLVRATNKFDKRLKRFILIFALLSIFSTIHIVNRTGLVLGAASFIAALFVPPCSKNKIAYTLLIIAILATLYFVFLSNNAGMADAIQSYADRDTGSQSISSAGGRTERWFAAIVQIFSTPFGNPFGLRWEGGYSYAHNLWLDAGVKSGIIPMILLISITITYCKKAFFAVKYTALGNFEKGVVMLTCLAFMLQASTEPVIDGCFQFFLFMFFSLGMFKSLNRRFARVPVIQNK